MTEASEVAEPSQGMGRASAILAAGTVVSRILGFVRAAVLTTAIGGFAAGDAFAVGNQLPNNIYALIAGGVLSAVLVPQIVKAAAHADGGQQYINRVVTLGIVIFAIVAVIATLAAPFLVSVYAQSSSHSGHGFSPAAFTLATAFAYWCLPQIFFYALYSLLSEVLNARKIFGPFTWAPVLNNIVAIAGLIVFMLLFGASAENQTVETWDTSRIVLLGATTTLGVAAQALVLFLFWRRAGLTYRPDFRWRGVGLGATGRAAGWLFGMILITQLAGIVQSRVASIASGDNASLFVLQNSWLIFMLPHSVIAVSIATAYFTQLSGHASRGDLAGMRQDLSASLRSIGLLIVFAAVALSVVAYPFARVFIDSGFDDVRGMGNVILAFMPGLILFSMLFVLQRVFYALGDTRTPFFMQCVQSGLFVIGALLCILLPTDLISVGIAAVTSTAGSAQAVVAIVLVRRRLRGMDGARVLRRHLQYLGLALLAGVVGILVLWLLGGFSAAGFAQSGKLPAILAIIITGALMTAVYFGMLLAIRNPEIHSVSGTLTARFRRKG
ncbi:murein biosynthesis integral membrane protein MurJ [Glaciihabitans sp. UYNi722]|uniref:murein biosynthesis integral membrane protein MurJ n=1 Tax=Glaciihabitans sp. UYNi722 TaxID=3156344 RepID=UPI00339B6FA9